MQLPTDVLKMGSANRINERCLELKLRSANLDSFFVLLPF